MSDIFISYARPDEGHAKKVADALRSAGHKVWRDDELPAHRAYAEVIEERLKFAKAVVVLWSAEAAKSQWVRAEADAARGLGTLIQATLDGTIPPLPFNQIQCADLVGWRGDPNAHGWRKLVASVEALTGCEKPSSAAQTVVPARLNVAVCVLPFANMSGDAEQEYFSDGISEDITTDLSKVSALAVVARNTAFTFKGQSVDVSDVARRLGVSHVLEGSVRKAGGRVRINAQLIDGRTGDHVWAERYDRDLDDIFAIQDEITKEIVAALKLRLLPEEKRAIEGRCTCDADAYNLYLMARNCWVTGNHGDMGREQRVERICQRAVEIDPQYARAWALMAIAQSSLRFGFAQPGDGGLEAAERALALDPDIAEAYCVAARHHLEAGRLADAAEEIEKGLRLDPGSWEVNKAAGAVYLKQGRLADAAAHYERAVAAMQTDFHGWGMLVTCYQALADKPALERAAAQTIEQAERALAEDPTNGAAISFAVMGLAALGEAERAREWMGRALRLDPDNMNMRYNFACALASGLRDPERAIDMLAPVLERTRSLSGNLDVDPDLESIRDNPRFQQMVAAARKRLGLAGTAPAPTPASSERPRS